MKKLANILLIFVMCFVLVGCGKDEKEKDLKNEAVENVKALVAGAQQHFVDSITNGEGFVWEMEATDVDVTNKPTAGKIVFTANPTGSTPYVTATGVVYGDYTCTYENETVTCTK